MLPFVLLAGAYLCWSLALHSLWHDFGWSPIVCGVLDCGGMLATCARAFGEMDRIRQRNNRRPPELGGAQWGEVGHRQGRHR